MDIVINRIKPQKVRLYDPENQYMGMVNEYELNDILIQIKQNHIGGYYVKFNRQKIEIRHDGRIQRPPIGFFDLMDNQMEKIMGF